jgi:prepilin-type N-terminal cleavage/methylation domain-containing protein
MTRLRIAMKKPIMKRNSGNKETMRGNKMVRTASGYSLVELMVVVVIGLVTTAIAVPLVQNAIATYQVRSAVSAVTGVIQATRFQAISAGYPYRIVFNISNSTYQVFYSTAGYTAPNWVAVTNPDGTPRPPIPFSNSSLQATMTLPGQTSPTSNTLDFKAGGLVVTPAVGAAGSSTPTFSLNFKGLTETIAISTYGSITVTP